MSANSIIVRGSVDQTDASANPKLKLNADGSLIASLSTAGGTAVNATSIGADGIATTLTTLGVRAFGYSFNATTWDRVTKANAASRIVSAAASTNATSAKATAGTLKHITGYNAAAAVRYLKLYNKATAPTVGTDTPVLTIALAPSSFFSIGQEFYFSAGIAYALTVNAADADATALTAADVVGLNLAYA